MNLSAETCLRGVIDTLGSRIAPTLGEGFGTEVMRLAGLVLAITTNSLDDAAALRVAENDSMRALFGDAASIVTDTSLAARLRAAGDEPASGLKISELDAANDRLRGLLVDLHVHVEDLPGAPARTIESRIWRLLQQFEIARAPRR
jgi:hypothetical protein